MRRRSRIAEYILDNPHKSYIIRLFNFELFCCGGAFMLKFTAADISGHFRRIDRAYTAVMQPLCEQSGLAQTALDILLFLANNPGLDTAKDICTYRNLKPGIVSLYVDKLVGDGYIERRAVPNDRRKISLVCTAKAQQVIDCGRKYQESFVSRLTEGLSRAEIDECLRCFEVFDENLRRISCGDGTERMNEDGEG